MIREIRGEITRESINELAHSRINEFRERFFALRPFNPVSLQHPSPIVIRHTYGKGSYKEAATILYWRTLLPCSPRLERVKTYCQWQCVDSATEKSTPRRWLLRWRFRRVATGKPSSRSWGWFLEKWGMNMSLLQPYEGELGEKMLLATDWCLMCSRI